MAGRIPKQKCRQGEEKKTARKCRRRLCVLMPSRVSVVSRLGGALCEYSPAVAATTTTTHTHVTIKPIPSFTAFALFFSLCLATRTQTQPHKRTHLEGHVSRLPSRMLEGDDGFGRRLVGRQFEIDLALRSDLHKGRRHDSFVLLSVCLSVRVYSYPSDTLIQDLTMRGEVCGYV